MSFQLTPTDPATISDSVDQLRNYFNTDATRSLEWRKKTLIALKQSIVEHREEWEKAMYEDMRSHSYEASLLIKAIESEIDIAIAKLPEWMSPTSTTNSWSLWPGKSEIQPEPYGVVCDFIPFNYPFFLGYSTLIPIIAAGNVCLFKPSSNTPACAALYQKLFKQYLDNDAIKVVCGPTKICDDILKCRFDFIFYTGSPRIARVIMRAAAEHLTPVLLELGGKSPCYFDKSCSLAKCVRRLLWGKIFNGGQTCVAPDYVLCNESIFDQMVAELKVAINEFYGDVEKQESDNITHIINDQHFSRLIRAIETSGGEIVVKGLQDRERKYIGPTVIINPSLDSQLMTEEIFGPIIPIIKVKSQEEAVAFINSREKPLACYVMTSDSKQEQYFASHTSSGALMFNDTTFHVSAPNIPFGGVGNSGMGQYHGEAGFNALSHMKPVVWHGTGIDLGFRYPPYSERSLSILKPFI